MPMVGDKTAIVLIIQPCSVVPNKLSLMGLAPTNKTINTSKLPINDSKKEVESTFFSSSCWYFTSAMCLITKLNVTNDKYVVTIFSKSLNSLNLCKASVHKITANNR